MNTEEIIDMARQAGFPFNKYGLLQGDDEGEIDADAMFEAFAKLVDAKATARERDKSDRLLWLFQEWKEDHLSQHNYIEAVEAIRNRGDL